MSEKKQCGGCGDSKTIHFFSAYEWQRKYDKARRCMQCRRIEKPTKRLGRKSPLSGTEIWRRDFKGIFARE